MARPIAVKIYRGEILEGVQVFERDVVKIGRLASTQIQLQDPKVSRVHAVIYLADGPDVAVMDMNSAEGTFLNGVKVRQRATVNHGDILKVGDTTLHLLLEATSILEVKINQAPPPRVEDAFASKPTFAHMTSTPEVTEMTPVLFSTTQTGSHPVAGSHRAAEVSLPHTVNATDKTVHESIQPKSADYGWATVTPPSRPTTASNTSTITTAIPPSVLVKTVVPPETSQHLAALPPVEKTTSGSELPVIEIVQRWGADVIEVQRVSHTPSFIIGMSDDVDMFFPFSIGGNESLTLLRSDAQNGWVLNVDPRFSGTVKTDGKSLPLSSQGASIPLRGDTQVTMALGHFTLDVQPAYRLKAPLIPPFFDALWWNILLSVGGIMLAMLMVVAFGYTGLDKLEDDLDASQAEFQNLILNPPKNDETLNRLMGKAAQGQKAAQSEGKAGNKKADPKQKDGRMAVKGPKSQNDAMLIQRKMDELLGVGRSGGLQELLGATDGSGELQAALGGITGSKVGDSYGSGGMGLRGGGPGGGGQGIGTMGTGSIGTRGRGSGEAGYGTGEGGLGKKSDRDITMTQGTPDVSGSLDPEIIRRVVRENSAAIRYCYEKELQSTPGLAGKIAVKWTISPQGRVTTATVVETLMKNRNVENCLASRVRNFVFPEPKGGGNVVVTFPFVFRAGG